LQGTKFFYENGTQFYMKGIAYQQDSAAKGQTNTNKTDYIDPLSDEDLCKKDVPLLEELGINTIRTYAIDPEADHSGCMKLLDDAGIYVISDLSQPALSIVRNNPTWNVPLYNRYKAVVDELAQYSNVIGFFAGNEVSDASNNTEASAYVKAALRDTKKFIKDQDYGRTLGVGYASNDHPDIREEIAQYFNCGPDEEATDYWGYNIYSWCQESTMQRSGYNDQIKFFENYNVPVFFAEYGCNEPDGAEGRIFQETAALYNDEMTEVFSGGLVYMYHQEANDYGVVEYKNGEPKRMKNFQKLKEQHAKADPKRVDESDYSASGDRETCPEIGDVWRASSNLPPTPDEDLCDCMVAASSCVATDDLDVEDFGDIFDDICGQPGNLCAGISGNATTGVYGAYHGCSDRAKLAHILDVYYQAQDEAFDACDFDGAATTQEPSAASSCDDALASASSINEEAATATSPLDNASSTGGSGSGSDSGNDEGAAFTSTPISRISLGNFAVGLYMVVAMGVGALMVAL
jgi:1,3-beta-glucanosyltransferase GAS1